MEDPARAERVRERLRENWSDAARRAALLVRRSHEHRDVGRDYGATDDGEILNAFDILHDPDAGLSSGHPIFAEGIKRGLLLMDEDGKLKITPTGRKIMARRAKVL